MSCHDIGRGMNSVVRTTVMLMENGKVSKEAARTIIGCCRNSVYWCDGNEYEAIEYIRNCMCGRCMSLIQKGKKLYSVYDVSSDVPNSDDLMDNIASDRLCEECFDIVINEHCKDDTAGERERRYIEATYAPKDYISTGEYEAFNNGCRWVNYQLP